MNNNQNFNKYLKEEFEPAWRWAHTEEGKAWIRTEIPSLWSLATLEDIVLAATYLVVINDHAAYVGQSLRTIRRLYVHSYHLFTNPEKYFGIQPDEIRSIEMKIMTPYLFKESDRLAAEAQAIKNLSPVLQPYSAIDGMRADTCVPRNCRRKAMQEAGVC